MRPLASLDADVARRLRGVLFDLDDTLLTHGVLTRGAYDALWDLHDAGLRLVAVTGRPSAWGELVARQWPVDGAIAENGAVHIVRAGKAVKVSLDGEPAAISHRRAKLDALVGEVARVVPRAKLADDHQGRRSDVAWDVGEHETLPEEDIAAIVREAVRAGARTTRSSVHLHATFERDDKASGAVRFLHDRFGEDVSSALGRYAFVGDSGNDAPCFSAFFATFGVANVRAFVPSLSVPPRWVAPGERGEGFAEIAHAILALRGGTRA